MKGFIKRNSPVFVVGVLTLIVFVIIIAASQKKTAQTPMLQEISEVELIAPHTYVRGDMKAPVTLVLFCDFNEPECGEYYTYVDSLYQSYKDYLKIAFRHFAPANKLPAIAAQAAGEQNKFWEFAKLVFDNPDTETPREKLISFASQLNMDSQKFVRDIDQEGFGTIVNEDTAFAEKINIESTPAFLLNGQRMTFKHTADFKDQVEVALKKYSAQTETTPVTTPISTNPVTPTEQNTAQRFTAQEIAESSITKEIAFTEAGWNPQSTYGYPGQLVKWTNQTTQAVKLVQLDQKFPELNKGVEILPGSSFEFRLYKDRLWRYMDKYTEKWAEIFIRY